MVHKEGNYSVFDRYAWFGDGRFDMTVTTDVYEFIKLHMVKPGDTKFEKVILGIYKTLQKEYEEEIKLMDVIDRYYVINDDIAEKLLERTLIRDTTKSKVWGALIDDLGFAEMDIERVFMKNKIFIRGTAPSRLEQKKKLYYPQFILLEEFFRYEWGIIK